MRKPKLATLTFAMLFAAAAASIGAVAAASVVAMGRLNVDASLRSLGEAAAALSNDPALAGPDAGALAVRAARGTSLRITVIGADGRVLGDSAADPEAMENHAKRPEVAAAIAGERSTSVRKSATLGVEMAYAAAPYSGERGEVAGVVRVAMSLPDLSGRVRPFVALAVAVAALTAVAMAVASAGLGSTLTGPVAALTEVAGDWSAGRLDRRIKRLGRPELEPLADTMNAMAAELAERIASGSRQRRELEAILDGMGEAVLSADSGLVIRLANPRALEILSRSGDEVVGRSILQATGSVAIDELARRCAAEGERLEAEIPLYGEQVRHLVVKASPMVSDDGGHGAVIVLNDITRLKRLETVRKDFVANVSHELRTPITLIKGFAETLGRVDDHDEAARFLSIIVRHADRMSAIIDDLLTLARLENPDRDKVETQAVSADELISKAIESLVDKAAAKGIELTTDCPPSLAAEANEGLLEQALVNLLDNAIKYSPKGSSVSIKAVRDGGFARFTVVDDGPGIPARDLPRLFERFYTVDKTRSRELGGTGLGLAIVRHIAAAHGGEASVESREGAGSAFTIKVPAAGSEPLTT